MGGLEEKGGMGVSSLAMQPALIEVKPSKYSALSSSHAICCLGFVERRAFAVCSIGFVQMPTRLLVKDESPTNCGETPMVRVCV